MKTHIKTQGQARLFNNPILEFFTKSSVWESTISTFAIAIGCIILGLCFKPLTPIGTIVLFFFMGLIAWSLFEYLLHRYIFHIAESAFRGSKRLQYLLHGVHHEYPNDAQRTLMPFLPKLIISVLFLGIFSLIMGVKGSFFSAGFIIGYYLYSMIHYSIHRFKAPRHLQFLWLHHHLHHHQQEDKAFGVSSRFWDKVFGTMPIIHHKKRDVTV